MGKILPLLIALIGLGLGVGAGLFLRPPPETAEAEACITPEQPLTTGEAMPPEDGEEGAPPTSDFVKLNNQFVIPVVSDEAVKALVVLSLTIEVTPGSSETVYQREPKLRDAFLQVLFDHANAGGFDGAFTSGSKMNTLRMSLSEEAQQILGPMARDVLVTDIVRQDI